ncbi:unnamed protein product [Arabidopsis halleri]
MIVNGDSWPDHFIVDANVFNKNPNELFNSERPRFVIVKPRTEACGKTDGCESGCWRIMGRDKLIKSEETGKILGFKKILKFCKKTKPREYKRSWVMEEYRLTKNLNWKQDHVICKIRLMFEAEISFLLTKHFYYTTSESVLGNGLFPSYGYSSTTQEEDESYMETIVTCEGNYWPSYVTNDVYCLHPVDLVDPQDPMFHDYGICIFANGTCGETDTCDGGYWKILHHDKLITGKVNGFKKVFKFYETRRYVCEGEDVKVTWTIEEYRLSEKEKEDKVICVINFIMEDDATFDLIKAELLNAEDEIIILRYLKRMIVNGDSWPDHFIEDADVFNKNPNVVFDAESPSFVIVKPRTEACVKVDGSDESGCWRIMGRDKLIKSKKTGKILGFKKILKFCLKRKPREYKRSWVMEEYRLTNNLNWKQDHVICKIRFLFEAEISFLLAKHFYTTSESLPRNELLPAYGFLSSDKQVEDISYLVTIMTSEGLNDWPSYVTNDVYCLHSLELVDLQDRMFHIYGTCIFANKTCDETDMCNGGYWKILHRDRLIKSKSGKTIGFKKVFKFHETEKEKYFCDEEDVKITWTIEEYRLSVKQNKFLCVIKVYL